MSEDLLKDWPLIEDLKDEIGNSLDLTMEMNGHAFLTLTNGQPRRGNIVKEETIAFSLPPDEKGFQLAQTLERQLKWWREHVKDQ